MFSFWVVSGLIKTIKNTLGSKLTILKTFAATLEDVCKRDHSDNNMSIHEWDEVSHPIKGVHTSAP